MLDEIRAKREEIYYRRRRLGFRKNGKAILAILTKIVILAAIFGC